MSDFITLSCPTCGGSIRLNSNRREYICEFCGQKHMIRKEDIESFGRCPVCNRNDRVEKVSAIFMNKSVSSSLQSRLKPPVEPILDRNKTIYLTKDIYLEEPKLIKNEPVYESNITGPGTILIMLMILVTIAVLIFVFLDIASGFNLFIPFIGMLVSVWLFKNEKKKYKSKFEEYKRIKEKNIKIIADWKIAANQIHNKWEQANNRWEECYYCHRDDVVFVPGEKFHKPLNKIKELLYRID